MTNEKFSGPLLKEIYHNPLIEKILSSTIQEWDIKAAHLMALSCIYGKDNDLVLQLKKMDKTTRNIEIGKLMIGNKNFVKEIQNYLFLFKKEFLIQNNIKPNNIIETTKDSIILTNKIPTNLKLEINGNLVEFINKDGIFSSYYRLKNNKSIFFDNITRRIRIKGINEETVKNSIFVNKCLIPLLVTLEGSVSMGNLRAIKSMKHHRYSYIDNDDLNIYKSLNDDNKFLYHNGNEIIYSDYILPENENNLIKTPNYMDYMMPLMRCVL
jgi:hypothetical protein